MTFGLRLVWASSSRKIMKQFWTKTCVDLPKKALQKLAYATISGDHTVFFSKRRKNSSLCGHRVAAWLESSAAPSFNSSSKWQYPLTLVDVGLRLHNATLFFLALLFCFGFRKPLASAFGPLNILSSFTLTKPSSLLSFHC